MLRRRTMMASGGGIDYSKIPLTIEMVDAGTITFQIATSINQGTWGHVQSVSYSIDGGSTWVTTPNVDNTLVTITTPSVPAGAKVLWKGIGCKYANNGIFNDAYNSRFVMGATRFKVYGNMRSMLYGDDFVGKTGLGIYHGAEVLTVTTTSTYGFARFFQNCGGLIDAANLLLPYNGAGMPASAYHGMFFNCSSLVSAPILPDTSLASHCYNSMFYNCSSLVSAPKLPATTLAASSYSQLFRYCGALSHIEMLATDISANSCLWFWVGGVAATGTFVKNSAATWTDVGDSGVPANWSIEYETI